MEIIKKEFKVYDFDELEKDIQEKLIEKEKDDQHELYLEYYLFDDMEEKARELLIKYFGKNANLKDVYYSLSYRQGDGAMFEFDGYYSGKYFQVKHEGYYYHNRCFRIWESNYNDYYFTDKQFEKLKEKIIKMFEEFEKYGWELVEFYISEEEAKNFLKGFKYLESGEIFE